MKTANIKNGSALIMTIVLTVLLAVIGILFVVMARMEKTATSARSESEELKLAADSVVSTISQRLADDVPKNNDISGFYDYPGRWDAAGLPDPNDLNDCWLANLEPEDVGGYQWRHITDLYNSMGTYAYDVSLNASQAIREDYPGTIDVNAGSVDSLADADGDGVADARWVAVPNLTTSKGKPVYAAIRIVDNGGMLNVNTAYQFDPNSLQENRIDGSSQMQINLVALSERDSTNTNLVGRLFYERFDANGIATSPAEPILPNLNYDNYNRDVVWRLSPVGTYTPFDISDEFKLRNRYILGDNRIVTRVEEVWNDAYDDIGFTTPRDNITGINGVAWFYKANHSSTDPNQYDYRHISTTYNMDRVIAPDGGLKEWINDSAMDVQNLYERMLISYDPYDPNFVSTPPEIKDEYAQIAVNIKDYVDNDSNVTAFQPFGSPDTYYGLERPLIYVTELAWNVFIDNTVAPPVTHLSYAIEVYSRLSGGQEPNLMINGTKISNTGAFVGSDGSYYVFRSEDAVAPLAVTDPNTIKTPANAVSFDVNDVIKLICIAGGDTIVIDSVRVPSWFDATDVGLHSYRRDMGTDRLIQRAWDSSDSNSPSLGSDNNYASSVDPLQTFIANDRFKNVGDVGLMFKKPAYYLDTDPNGPSTAIGYTPAMQLERDVRINLADPNVQKIFNYITVFNPSLYDPNNGTRVKGRININTAPWFVIKQLPWVGLRSDVSVNDANSLARAIESYRDKANFPNYGGINGREAGAGHSLTGLREIPGFASIGELTTVVGILNGNDMWHYSYDANDQPTFPDLTPSDGVANDFEEQNLIFARISDLVTVRSDVFTAYILIRLGDNGPQRRVMAILDRSEGGNVKIVAMQEVPDAR